MVGSIHQLATEHDTLEVEQRARIAHSITKVRLSAPTDAGVRSRVSNMHKEEELQQ